MVMARHRQRSLCETTEGAGCSVGDPLRRWCGDPSVEQGRDCSRIQSQHRGSGHEFAGIGGHESGWADNEGIGDTDDGMVLVGVVEPGED